MKKLLAYLVLVLVGVGAGAAFAAYSANNSANAASARTAAPSTTGGGGGAPAGAFAGGPSALQGQVSAKDASSMTVKTATGEQKFTLSEQTRVNVSKPAAADALKADVNVLVTGAPDASGKFQATSISIQPAGAQAFGGPQGGAGGANGGAFTGRAPGGNSGAPGGNAGNAQGNNGRNAGGNNGGNAVRGGAAGGNAPAGGAPGGNGGNAGGNGRADRGNFLVGKIVKVDGQDVTLTSPQGDETFHIAPNAKIVSQEPGTLDSIATGSSVSVTEAGAGGPEPRAVLVVVEAA